MKREMHKANRHFVSMVSPRPRTMPRKAVAHNPQVAESSIFLGRSLVVAHYPADASQIT